MSIPNIYGNRFLPHSAGKCKPGPYCGLEIVKGLWGDN